MYLPKVNLLFSMGRYAEAEPVLREALARNPDDSTAHAMLGVALSRIGRTSEALRESENAIGLGPVNPYAFYANSLVLIRSGRSALALGAVREALRLDSTNPEYFLILGALLFDKQEWNAALGALDQALAIEPTHVRSLNLRGRTLLQLGRREEAEQAMKSALAAAPENADAHHARGVLLLAGAQSDEALDHLLEARRLNPVTRNDSAAIAMAVGWQLIPFRWIGRRAIHWDLWPARSTWAVLAGLMFTLVSLNAFIPVPRQRHLAVMFFGMAVTNLLLIPFTLDLLATTAARIARGRLVGSPWRKLGRQAVGLLLLFWAHAVVTVSGDLPSVVLLVLAWCACKDFGPFARRRLEWSLGHVVFVLYILALATLAVAISVQVLMQPRGCLLTAAVFAVLTFSSDNVLRWIQRREM